MSGYSTLNVDISNVYQTQAQVLNILNTETTSNAYINANTANSNANTANSNANTANSNANTANSNANSSYTNSVNNYNYSNTAINTANTATNNVNGIPYISNSGGNSFFEWYLYFNNLAIQSASGTGGQALYSRYTGNFGGYYILSVISSSIKTKTNIYDITPEESAQVYKMRPVKFNFKDDLEKECIGFIAEEMFEVEPRVVPYNIVDGVKEPVSINYEHLVPLLVAEIKNLKKYTDELKEKIDNLI